MMCKSNDDIGLAGVDVGAEGGAARRNTQRTVRRLAEVRVAYDECALGVPGVVGDVGAHHGSEPLELSLQQRHVRGTFRAGQH